MADLITPEQLRILLQFDQDDISVSDMSEIIRVALIKVNADVSTGDNELKTYAALLWSRYLALRALASKAVSKGYVSATVEGRTVTKNHNELSDEAEIAKEDYNMFIRNQFTSEASRTDYMSTAQGIDSETRSLYVDLLTGVTNALYSQSNYKYSSGDRDRRR